METYFANLKSISERKMNEEQRSEVNKHIDIIEDLPPEHAKVYLEQLLETWVKAFLTA